MGGGDDQKKDGWWSVTRNFLAGYNSGVFLVLAGHPFDTVKVRMQVDPERFRGPIQCVRDTIRHEGPLATTRRPRRGPPRSASRGPRPSTTARPR